MKPAPFLASLLAGRSARERQLLLLAVVVVGAALLIVLADWAMTERRRLGHRLPAAAAQLQRMYTQAGELARLQSGPPAATPAADSLVEVVRSAALTRGLALEVTPAANGVEVTGNANLEPLLDWLASVQAEQRLYPARITLQEAPQGLRVEALLATAVP